MLNISTYKKRTINNIRKYLLNQGMEPFSESQDSNSVYLKTNGLKVRISDHIAPGFGTEFIDVICTAENNSGFVTVINGGVMIHESLSELKSFLKATCKLIQCNYFTSRQIMDGEIRKKNKRLQEIKTELSSVSHQLDETSKSLRLAEKNLNKIQSITIEDDHVNISKLTNKQKNNILLQIQNYKNSNKN